MKKVSIMLPVYNAENFICECLDSILNQDYQNIEIVVSDDASTDRTVEVINEMYSRFLDRIIINVNPENIGISKNCNLALSRCDGDYVCLFAGDDVMMPGKISEQVALLEADPEASLCYHRVEIFNHVDGFVLEVTEAERTIYSVFDIIEKGGLPGANSVMVRRDAIPGVGYNENIASVSDWLFFIEVALRGKIIFSEMILARYRKHGSGCSSKADFLIGETLETVDFISRRFNNNPKVSNSCKKAKIRYLMGSIARLIASKNKAQLMLINEGYIKDVSRFIYYVVDLYCRLGLINTSFGLRLFNIGKALIGRRQVKV